MLCFQLLVVCTSVLRWRGGGGGGGHSTSLEDMEYPSLCNWFKSHLDANDFSSCTPSPNTTGHITDLGLAACVIQ